MGKAVSDSNHIQSWSSSAHKPPKLGQIASKHSRCAQYAARDENLNRQVCLDLPANRWKQKARRLVPPLSFGPGLALL